MGVARKTLTIAAQMLPLLIALAWCWLDPGQIIVRQRRAVFDYYQRIAPRTWQDTPVRIVDIDDASLARLGQWPWPRSQVAALVTRLSQAGAAAIVLDIVFAEPDRTSPAQSLALWAASGTDIGKAREALSALPDHDVLLAKAIHDAGNVVTGFALTGDVQGRKPALRTGFASLGDDPLPFVQDFKGAITSLPVLEKEAGGNGSVTFTADDDFIIRRVPLVTRLSRQLYPTLTSEALRVAQGAHSILIKSTGASREYGSGDQVGIVGIRIGDISVPTDAQGQLMMHYTAPEARRSMPAWQVLSGNFDAERVKGRIILIGTSATGLRDIRPSPINAIMPGVEADAQALEQMLLGHYLQRPDWARAAEFCFVLVVGGLLVLLLRLSGAVLSGVIGLAAIAAAFAGSWHAYSAWLMLLDPVTAAVAVFAVYLSSTIIGYLRTEAQKRQVRGAFSRYLSPDLVEELTRNPARLKLGGDLRVMSFLFCDIRGFTRMCERSRSNPQGLTQLLNSFLTPMTDIILSRRGTIDKYMGDCIMAFWNAPLDDARHGEHACASALAMIAALEPLNAVLRAKAEADGSAFEPLNIGIGVNTGECVVGNMGSDQRFDYSVLGDSVNLASRMESLSKLYRVGVVISQDSLAVVPDWAVIELDLIVVQGRTEPIHIYALLGGTEATQSAGFAHLRTTHTRMLDAYRRQRWADALDALEDCRSREPRLAGLYALYAARIQAFMETAPPPGWQGIYYADAK